MMNEERLQVNIQCVAAAKLNFSGYQSAFPFLRELQLGNESNQMLENIEVILTSNPAFLVPKSWRVDRIAPGRTIAINDRDIHLDGNFLLNLSDAMAGRLDLVVIQDGKEIVQLSKPVELLAYNEWGGAGYMPELIAAFSMPNDPAVDRVLRDASLILRKANKPDGIDGYQKKSRERVWEITSAIYTALCNLNITYAVPPQSFEQDGQKIRLPGQILENKIATCLDSTMLFASALEQAGLNPIVIMPEGHAFVGVWLQPEELSTIVINEAESLRKRVQLNELLLVETTVVTNHPAPPFSKAVDLAVKSIGPEHDDTFNSAVDIKRARAHRISPLGLKSAEQMPKGEEYEQKGRVELTLEEAPSLPSFDEGIEEDEKPDTPMGRLDRWQRKLLDLSARNPLLNHKSAKTSLRLICPDPARLEDMLADGTRFSIISTPKASAQEQDEALHQQRTGESITDEYALNALQKKQLLVDLDEGVLSKRLVEIYRKVQTALQEGGANTLYLAIGFLLWKRDEKDNRRFRAPLILLPVTLERKSVRSGFKMIAHDDEPRFNTTLLEMLKKDFGIDIRGLDGKLPEDDSGIDVPGVWDTVRRAIRDAAGFEVVEEVVMGHFSFAKYLMWKDLVDRTEILKQNGIVKHLIDSPRDPYPSNIEFVEGDEIDRSYAPQDLLTPLQADSSQMAAIATADRGKDFIIIGPPGTGKSQTISNLIAHMLGKGKTILFVSEKTAALDVVYRRLKDVGLNQFCLELHSNKANKSDVLKQLNHAWTRHGQNSKEEWEREAKRLKQPRDHLNHVAERLHMRRRNGLSVHYAIGVKTRDEALANRVSFSWASSQHHDEVVLEQLRDAVDKLQVQANAVGDISESKFALVERSDWSPQWEKDVSENAVKLAMAVEKTEAAADALLASIAIERPNSSVARMDALYELATVLIRSYRKQTGFALSEGGSDQIDSLIEAVDRLKRYAALQSELSCVYAPMAWRDLDGEEIAAKWSEAEGMWWPKSFFAKRSILQHLRSGGAKGNPNPGLDAKILTELRVEGEKIDRLDQTLSGLKDWSAHTTDPEAVESLHTLGKAALHAVGGLAEETQSLLQIRSKVRMLLIDGNDLLGPDAAVGRSAQEFIDTYELFNKAVTAFESTAGASVRAHFAESKRSFDSVRETAEAIVANHAELHDWCSWRRRRSEAMDLQLAPLVEAVETGRVPANEIKETFEAAYCSWFSGAVIGEDETLRTFSTPEQNNTIEQFRELDTRFQKLTADYIRAKLSGDLPYADDVKRSSSWGVLRHEIQKKRQHKPVRQLIQEIPDVLTTLAPCLMMSPLSVAQYLPAGQELFDVVIFDEASQITVWDAVGTLARGKQAIIAGDPKQMPPTNFFSRGDDDSDGDLESILDEMLGASIPQRTLNLHYRSRKESLIAFSNNRYYDNSLVTFPAPVHPDKGVSLVRPQGFYARGKARHNEGEAKAIVAEVLRRLTHEDDAIRNQSIGVVTFNSEQQSLIENLLDTARGNNPEIEWAFSNEKVLEPVFVKNLETVQGDERDVIMFSITYGRDQNNHITMNFGPLNRDGGERRLNVAMTRARSEMIVFSTMSPDQIDLSRTQARAVADLKHFLSYAEHGSQALVSAVHGSLGDFDSPFEVDVARALREKGWDVHPQVGVSAYRIDLGIVHPDVPGIYLAGIECDGAMYHSSAFARERDKIRQSVLEGLGWTLFRVWSTDWWTNKVKATNVLHDLLIQCLEEDRKERSKKEQKSEQIELFPEKHSSAEMAEGQEVSIKSKDIDKQSQEEEGAAQSSNEVHDPVLLSKQTLFKEEMAEGTDLFGNDGHEYLVASLDNPKFRPDPEAFYEEDYEKHLSDMIDFVIDVEGPIHEDILVRRIAKHHGFARAGRQIKEIVTNLAKKRRGKTHEDVGYFYWRKGTIKEREAPARYKERDVEMRKIEFICNDEIRAIAKELRVGKDSTELARRIGIGRLSKSARERIESVIQVL